MHEIEGIEKESLCTYRCENNLKEEWVGSEDAFVLVAKASNL